MNQFVHFTNCIGEIEEVFKEQPETVNKEVEIRPIRMTANLATKTQTPSFCR